jgi:hypothetical protein
MTRTVKVCRDVSRAGVLGLGPLPPSAGRIVGVEVSWNVDDSDGVEGDGARAFFLMIARALVDGARVTFLDEALEPPLPQAWEPRGADHVVELPLGSMQAWTRRLTGLLGFDETRGVLSTRRAERAARLFDSSYFHWWAQAQFALLSAPDAAPPPIDAEAVSGLLGDGWQDVVRSLGSSGVIGGMRPGTDGDLLGLFFLDPARGDAFLSALAREAELDGLTVTEVPSEAFP